MKIIKFLVYFIMVLVLAFSIGIKINYEFFHIDEVKATPDYYDLKVYITPTGECYHSKYCSHIKDKSAIGKEQAIKKGYRICSFCKGVTNEIILIEGQDFQPEQNNYLFSFIVSYGVCGVFSIIIYLYLKKRG